MTGWIIYDKESYKRNKNFSEMLIKAGQSLGIKLVTILTEDLSYDTLPDFVIMRSYDYNISKKFEDKNVKVFNSSKVSEICNDKMNTFLFFKDKNLPLMETKLIYSDEDLPFEFPFVVKPVDGHGGDGVNLVNNYDEYMLVLKELKGRKIIAQKKASDTGKDLRVYVVGNEIIAGMLRISKNDFRSNFSLGGEAFRYILTEEETEIVKKVTDNLYFDYAGIDLIYDNGAPVLNEIEDVVGARMLYKNTDIDICQIYMKYIKEGAVSLKK